MRAHIKRWVNEKYDVITAENMKEALESHGGLEGCRVAVVQVDTTKSLENEIALENLRIAVNLQVSAHQHPIDVRNKNLCELSKAKKLDILKVAELREMCESLELEVSGSLARKKSFIEPLNSYAKCCTCFTRAENERLLECLR